MKTRGDAPVSLVVLFLAILALVITSASAVNAQQTSPAGTEVVGAPTFQVGDFWKYRYLNKKGGFAQSVIEVNDKGVVLSSAGGKKVTLSPEGNVVSGYGTVTGKAVSYEPPIPRLQFPLWVGKAWSVSYTASSGGWQERAALDVKVAAMESVAVEAGTFKAMKLEMRFSTGNQEVCWYAAEVKRFVKCEYTDPSRNHELASFRLKPLLPVAEATESRQ